MTIQARHDPAASRENAFQGGCRLLAVVVLCAGAILGPLALGGTGPVAQFALDSAMALAVALWWGTSRGSSASLFMPLVVAVIALLQLMPLPDSLLLSLAPPSAGAWKIANEGVPGAWGSISVDPAATATAVRRLLLGMATIATVADMGRTGPYRKWFAVVLSITAVLVWGLGVAFPVKRGGPMLGSVSLQGPLEYWKTPVARPVQTGAFGFPAIITAGDGQYVVDEWVVGDGFGPYIVSNHFAFCIYVTLPLLFSLWLVATRQKVPDWLRFAVMLAALAAGLWTVGFAAQSRAGAIALLFMASVFFALVVEHPLLRGALGWLAAGFAAFLLAAVLAFHGPFDGWSKELVPEALQPVVNRMLEDGRVKASRAAGRMFLASPTLGTGLATYGPLYPRFVRQGSPWYFAHNDYAQLLSETGLVGAGIAIGLAALVARRFWLFYREPPALDRPLRAGFWAALAGIAVHSAFDWNLHVPANAFLFCIVSGVALAGIMESRQASAIIEPRKPGMLASWARWPLIAACLIAWGFLGRDMVSEVTQRQLRDAITTTRLPKDKISPEGVQQSLEQAIAAGTAVAGWDGSNGRLLQSIGQAYLHLAVIRGDDSADMARAWFARARRCCAVCRGLPGPVQASRAD